MTEESFTVRFANSSSGGYLTTRSFMKVKVHDIVRLHIRKPGERSYINAMLTVTKDAYRDGTVRVIEGVMIDSRVTGPVTLEYYERFNNAVLMRRKPQG